MKLWGVLSVLYSAVVVVIALTKPEKIWNMRKIQFFRKIMGDKGTEIFFYVWAVIFLALGIWLFTR